MRENNLLNIFYPQLGFDHHRRAVNHFGTARAHHVNAEQHVGVRVLDDLNGARAALAVFGEETSAHRQRQRGGCDFMSGRLSLFFGVTASCDFGHGINGPRNRVHAETVAPSANCVERHFAHAGRRVRQLRFTGHIADCVDVRQIRALLFIHFDAAPVEVESGLFKSHTGQIRNAADRHQDDISLNGFFFTRFGRVLHVMTVDRRDLAAEVEFHFALKRFAEFLGLFTIHERNNFFEHFNDVDFDAETAEEAGELNAAHAAADYCQRFGHLVDAQDFRTGHHMRLFRAGNRRNKRR